MGWINVGNRIKNGINNDVQNKKLSLLKLRNGELIGDGVYPLIYRKDILNIYKSSKSKKQNNKFKIMKTLTYRTDYK